MWLWARPPNASTNIQGPPMWSSSSMNQAAWTMSWRPLTRWCRKWRRDSVRRTSAHDQDSQTTMQLWDSVALRFLAFSALRHLHQLNLCHLDGFPSCPAKLSKQSIALLKTDTWQFPEQLKHFQGGQATSLVIWSWSAMKIETSPKMGPLLHVLKSKSWSDEMASTWRLSLIRGSTRPTATTSAVIGFPPMSVMGPPSPGWSLVSIFPEDTLTHGATTRLSLLSLEAALGMWTNFVRVARFPKRSWKPSLTKTHKTLRRSSLPASDVSALLVQLVERWHALWMIISCVIRWVHINVIITVPQSLFLTLP